MIVCTNSAFETEEVGRMLGSLLQKSDFVALFGDLGGGKTCFTRGIVAATAPGSLHLVASPTFAIMNEYPGPVPVYHFDFYRLTNSHEIVELGFEEFFQDEGICIAEWSERLEDLLPNDHISVSFEHVDGDCRKISFAAGTSHSQTLIDKLSLLMKSADFL